MLALLLAGATTYHFGASEARTNVAFEAKTDVALIHGTARRIEGNAALDWEAGTGRCELRVPVDSLRTGLEGRDRVMFSEPWLDAARFPGIEFRSEKGSLVKPPSTWAAEGKFTLRGVARGLSVTVDVRRIPDDLAKKAGLGPGEWIRVHAQFPIRLSDYGIEVPERSVATVEDTWTVTVDLFGTSEPPPATTSAPAARAGAPFEGIAFRKVVLEGGEGTRFRFGVKPQFTNLEAVSETEAGTLSISTNALDGAAAVDFAKGTGKLGLLVPVSSLQTGIEERDAQLRRAGWFDASKHRAIEFGSTRLDRKEATTWTLEGTLSIRGVSRPVALEVDLREIPGERMRQAAWSNRAGLGVRGSFALRLSEFGIPVPPSLAPRIPDEMRVRVDLVGIRE